MTACGNTQSSKAFKPEKNSEDSLNNSGSEKSIESGLWDSGEKLGGIDILLKATPEQRKELKTDTISGIRIENSFSEIGRLLNPDVVIVNFKSVSILFDYPLTRFDTLDLISSQTGFTTGELVTKICERYHQIYLEEEQTSSVKVIPSSERKKSLNRNVTNGKYGIWGHDIGDLYLTGLEIVRTQNGRVFILLDVDS